MKAAKMKKVVEKHSLKTYVDALHAVAVVRSRVLSGFGLTYDGGEPIDDNRTDNWLVIDGKVYHSETPITPASFDVRTRAEFMNDVTATPPVPDEYVNEIEPINIDRAEGLVLVYWYLGVDSTTNVYTIFDEAKEIKTTPELVQAYSASVEAYKRNMAEAARELHL